MFYLVETLVDKYSLTEIDWFPFFVYQDDGGSPISNYVVERMDLRTGDWVTCSKFVRGTSYEVLNLDEGHEYKFRISAENEHGVGEPIEMKDTVVAQHPWSEYMLIVHLYVTLHTVFF